MLRIWKLCKYLRDFKAAYYSKIGDISEGYPANGVPPDAFVDYICEKGRITDNISEIKRKVKLELSDLARQDFLDENAEGYWKSAGGTIVHQRSYLGLGWKGRKILKPIYLLEYLIEDHKVLTGVIFGALTWKIWASIWGWILKAIEIVLNK